MNMIDCNPEVTHIPVTREEEGFGIAAGAYMGQTSHSHAEFRLETLLMC